MSTLKQKKELQSTINRMKAANKSKKGSFSTQQIGRVQYKLNQLSAEPKGNKVRSSSGKAVKTGTGGVVRQKPKVTAKPKTTTKNKTSNVTTYVNPRSNVRRVGPTTGSIGKNIMADRKLVANSNKLVADRKAAEAALQKAIKAEQAYMKKNGK